MPTRARYHAYEAHEAYLEHLCEAPSRMRYLALTDGREVRAICPLEARKDDGLRVPVPVPVWGLPLHPHWVTTDVICPEDEARAALLPVLVDYLRRESEGRGLSVVGPLPAESVLWQGLAQLRASQYCDRVAEPSSHFDCTTTYDELVSRLTKHFSRNLRSHRNKIAKLEGARFVTANEPPQLETEFDAFLVVEGSGWKGELGARSAVRLHPELTTFYRDLCANLRGQEQHCEINSLYVNDTCAASQFCVRMGATYAILKIGFDEEYSRLGPGQVLMDRTLKRCCEDPTVEVLDLVTYGAWQRDWRTDVTPMRQAYLALGPWPGRPLMALVRFRFGPGRRIVRWWRRRSADCETRSSRRSAVKGSDSESERRT